MLPSFPFTSVLVCRSLEIVLFADQSPTTAPLHGPYSYIFNIAAHRSGLVPRQLLSYGEYWPSLRSSSRWGKSSSMDERVEVQCPAFSNKVNPAFESTSHSCPPFNQYPYTRFFPSPNLSCRAPQPAVQVEIPSMIARYPRL
jgi:hypothetical protein